MHLSRAAALAAVAALLVPSAAGARQRPEAVKGALDRVVAAGAPGAVALAGDRTFAAGVADVSSGRPLRAGDRLRIGSVTKSFVAVVALQLVGEGRLRLSDTLGQRLPGVLAYGSDITLRQLLNHTSGVPDDVVPRSWRCSAATPRASGAGRRSSTSSATSRRASPPERDGRTHRLHPHGHDDRAGHGSQPRARARGAIVRPLGLRHTSFPVRDTRLGRHAARGYSLDLDPGGQPVQGTLRDITIYSPSFAWASGNGVPTLSDVARFYRALLGGGLLAPGLLRESLDAVPTGRAGRSYGLGLNMRDSPHGTLIGHDGDMPGFSIVALADRDGGRQAVVAVNMKFAAPAVDAAFDQAVDAAAQMAFGA